VTPAGEATSAADLREQARALLGRSSPDTAGLWPRAAALLGCQALELALDNLWHVKKLNLTGCGATAQLLWLQEHLGDAGLAEQAAQAWRTLSRACHHHHHPYELAPAVGESEGCLEAVGALAEDCATDEQAGCPT
jgi:hypothetical protein